METSNPSDAEFKTLVIKMLNELRGRVDKLSDNFNKEVQNKKNGDRKQKRTSQKLRI